MTSLSDRLRTRGTAALICGALGLLLLSGCGGEVTSGLLDPNRVP